MIDELRRLALAAGADPAAVEAIKLKYQKMAAASMTSVARLSLLLELDGELKICVAIERDRDTGDRHFAETRAPGSFG